MTAPLDPDVEAAGIAYRDAIVAGVGVFAAGERLRAAIRTACAAAERRGIERAITVVEDKALSDAWGERSKYRAILVASLCVLPVPESTEAGHG